MSIKLKRYYPIVLALVALVLFLMTVLANQQIRAYSNSKEIAIKKPGSNYSNELELFDDSIVHQIQILTATNTKEQMLRSYQITGDKDYFAADIIIDGVRINNIAIRLKGNASLKSVAKADSFFAGAMFLPPELKNVPAHCWAFSPIPAPPGLGKKKETVLKIPYLIKFDEFIAGQSYLGYKEFAIRSSGVSYDAAQLQEPLSNYALESFGLAASATAYISLQFNNEKKQLYTIAEVINQEYLDKHFPASKGVLYKVIAVGNDFKYLGSDLSLYANIFEQKTARKQADLSPLTKFMKFVSNASDEEFELELSQWLDTDSFASYLAIENLLVNFDSLAGMGNNYYLYYNKSKDIFNVLAWDANESLGKLGKPDFNLYWKDRFSSAGMPGFAAGPAVLAEGKTPKFAAETPKECLEAFAILEAKFGAGPPQQNKQALGRNVEQGPFGDGKHVLKDRFLASPKFSKLYKNKLKEAYKQIFKTKILFSKISEYQKLINSQESLDSFDFEAFNLALTKTKVFLEQRSKYLQSTELLKNE